MLYVLVHKNRVLNGPREWLRRPFELTLEELGISTNLPPSYSSQEAIVIDADTSIMSCEITIPPHNTKIEYAHGPFWDFASGQAIGTHEVVPISLEAIRNSLKQTLASVRWNCETSGIKYQVRGQTVDLDTKRETRYVYSQHYSNLADGDTIAWKFDRIWLTLTKEELGDIVKAINTHINQCFEWERSKTLEIDSCNTAQELDQIELEYTTG